METRKLPLLKHKKQGFYLLNERYNKVNEKRFDYFIRGKGTLKYKFSDFEILESEKEFDANSLWDIKEITKLYGFKVACLFVEYENVTATICVNALVSRANMYPIDEAFHIECIEKLKLNLFHSYDSMLGAFGYYSFDVISFDNFLKKHHGYTEEEHGSQKDFLTFKFGAEFANEFETKLFKKELAAA